MDPVSPDLDAHTHNSEAPDAASLTPEREHDRSRYENDFDEDVDQSDLPAPRVYGDLIAAHRVDADAVKVLKRLTRHGYEAYLVGGGVRDLLLGRSPKDFDIATSARPNEVKRLFRNCRVIGRRFRLAHVLFGGGKIIEVATFRRDPSAKETEIQRQVDQDDGGVSLAPGAKERGDDADLLIRHDNVFGLPHEDAIRRDFTINGLFYDLDHEEVIDYVGGVQHLEDGVVHTIGEPDVRFREDPVRILRAIKFSARLDLGISPAVYDAMVDQREELEKSAAPRLFEELLRFLRGGAAHRSLYLAWDCGVLGVMLPELSAYLDDQGEEPSELWGRLLAIDEMRLDDRMPDDAVLLTALLYDAIDDAVDGASQPAHAFEGFFEDITERLALPRRIRDRIRVIFAAQKRLERGRHSAIRRRDFFYDAAALYELRLSAAGREAPNWLLDIGDAPPPEPRPRPMQRRSSRRQRR